MNIKHLHARNGKVTKTFRAWQSMRARCYNKNNISYCNYGARGIVVCPEWLIFENFLRDMGECPPGYSLERINISENYVSNNCKWIPRTEQSKNRRGVHVVFYEGREWSAKDLATHLGITSRGIRRRIQRGRLQSKVITTPKQGEHHDQ
jgi:hypothetical protein